MEHRAVGASLWLLVVVLWGVLPGCSGLGELTLFPRGNWLLEGTRDVRHGLSKSAPIPRELEKTVLPAYPIEPGDTLLIEPVDLDSPLRLPADQTVLLDGTIDLLELGRPVVAGLTVEQIEAEINALVQADDPEAGAVNVRLINPQGAVYYVLGEIAAPGAYPLVGRETVLDGILTAGGLTERSSPCNIVLARPTPPKSCRVVLPICYRRITQLGDTSTNYQLKPGDRIYVATRSAWDGFHRDSCPLCEDLDCPCPPEKTTEGYPGAALLFPHGFAHGIGRFPSFLTGSAPETDNTPETDSNPETASELEAEGDLETGGEQTWTPQPVGQSDWP